MLERGLRVVVDQAARGDQVLPDGFREPLRQGPQLPADLLVEVGELDVLGQFRRFEQLAGEGSVLFLDGHRPLAAGTVVPALATVTTAVPVLAAATVSAAVAVTAIATVVALPTVFPLSALATRVTWFPALSGLDAFVLPGPVPRTRLDVSDALLSARSHLFYYRGFLDRSRRSLLDLGTPPADALVLTVVPETTVALVLPEPARTLVPTVPARPLSAGPVVPPFASVASLVATVIAEPAGAVVATIPAVTAL
ncbi:hypothetical protein, partial [Amycolatopsis echigonensis]|uniref:hypothetical protein n=1 Tax=Amycolatopsis echigonensis TaxID=2576905 RepID=UPI001FEAC3A9